MKNKIVILLMVLVNTMLSSSAQIYTCKEGTVSFFSEASFENIDATTTTVQCILNTNTKEIAFIIPIRGFKFKQDVMQEHFNEKYLESDKYPNASFSGKIKEDIDWEKDGTSPATASGKMKIHGVEKETSYNGIIVIKNGDISLSSSFPIVIKEYNIEIPKLVFQNISDTVAVKMNVNFQPYKK